MKKQLFLLLALVYSLIIVSGVSYALSHSPKSIDVTWIKGEEQPSDIYINFTGDPNKTIDVTLTKQGDNADFYSLSPTTFSLVNGSSEVVTVSFNIPSTVSEGTYSGKIYYGSDSEDYIPIYITVQESESSEGCKITTPFPEYVFSIKQNTEPYTDTYTFRISSECVGGVEIDTIKTSGTQLMSSGWQPIRITGGIPTGHKEPGESFDVTVEFDVSELQKGTYTSYLIVSGTYNDTSITSTIKFQITVVESGTPIQNFSSLSPPTFDDIPSTLVLNNTYSIVARYVNPNLEIHVEPNPYIYGISVEISDGTWKYTFKPVKTGDTIIKVWAEYQGAIIGTPFIKNVTISESQLESSQVLKFKFYPDLSELTDGSTLRVLLADNVTDNIITNFKLFLNGQELENNSFVVHSGETYHLVGTAPGYHSIETTITVNPKYVTLTIQPATPYEGDTINITTNPANATIYVNGTPITGNLYKVNSPGLYIIEAKYPGYEAAVYNLTVKKKIELINVPLNLKDTNNNGILELKRGQQYTFTISQEPEQYLKVIFTSYDGIPVSYAESETSTITFTPNDYGTYEIVADGKTIYKFEVPKRTLNLGNIWFWIILSLIIIGIAVIFMSKHSTPSSYPYVSSSESQDILVSP